MAAKRSLTNRIQLVLQRIRLLWSKRGLYTLLLALALTLLNHYAVHFPWIVDDHDILVKAMGLKKTMSMEVEGSNGLSRQQVARDFLLIDVSNDMALHCDTGANSWLKLPADAGKGSAPCFATIDLQKLIRLFEWLSAHPDQFNMVICDLAFEDLPINNQTRKLLLYAGALMRRQSGSKIIFAWTWDTHKQLFSESEAGKSIPPKYKGVVNEDLTSDLVLSYRLSYNNGAGKSLPLLMLERINHYSVQQSFGGLSWFTPPGGRSMLARNTFIPQWLLDNEAIDSLQHLCTREEVFADTLTAYMELWQTLPTLSDTSNFYLKEVLATQSTEKKNIFIGSFNHQHRDMHKTLYGDMDGAAIILNTYYSLLKGSNVITWQYYLFMYCIFWLVSVFLLFPLQNWYKGRHKWLGALLDIGIDLVQYSLFFILIFLSASWFHQTSNAIILLSAVALLEKLIRGMQGNNSRIIQS